MCGYFHIFCLTAKSQASFTRPPGITINLHSSMLTSRQCTYTENTKRQWTVNKPTNNLNDLICTDLVFSTYFFTFFFFSFLIFQLVHHLYTTLWTSFSSSSSFKNQRSDLMVASYVMLSHRHFYSLTCCLFNVYSICSLADANGSLVKW